MRAVPCFCQDLTDPNGGLSHQRSYAARLEPAAAFTPTYGSVAAFPKTNHALARARALTPTASVATTATTPRAGSLNAAAARRRRHAQP